MHTITGADDGLKAPVRAIAREAETLALLHQGLRRHVAAWEQAHEAAVHNVGCLIDRLDDAIARLESHLSARP